MVSNKNEIVMFLHCKLCLEELKKSHNASPRDYSRVEFGWTKKGLQVRCVRHDCNILHIDFEGKKHPANTSREPEK
jgi:hypothetical protein